MHFPGDERDSLTPAISRVFVGQRVLEYFPLRVGDDVLRYTEVEGGGSVAHKYFAFISYSHSDEKWAAWLHRALESYRPPKHLIGQPGAFGEIPSRLAPVFRDREELATSTDLSTSITNALSESLYLVVICSPASARSHWVSEEILAFRRMGGEDRILCLIVDGVEGIEEPSESAGEAPQEGAFFPAALRFKLSGKESDPDTSREPLAADMRSGKDGRNNAKLKLIAGMLGVGFDELKQREQARRQRRLMTIAAASAAGMLITTGLATAAWIARGEAQRQTQRAEAEAEVARQTTDFLVGLFKVADPSESRGNTITARELLDKGSARIESDLADQPKIQAALMSTMGNAYKSLGLYADARSLLQNSLQKRRRLSLTQAHSPEIIDNLTDLAGVLALQADYPSARALYLEALDSGDFSADADPVREARVQLGLAELYSLEGQYEQAEPLLREGAEALKNTLGERNLETLKAMEDLGLNLFDQGQMEEAETLLRRTLGVEEKLLDDAPHPQLANLVNNLAYLLHARGANDEAGSLFERSLGMNRKLLGDRHPTIAISLNNLAFLQHEKGNYAEAERLYRDAISMNRELLGPQHPEVADGLMNLAFVLYDEGAQDAAFQTARESIGIYRQMFPGDHPDLARVLTNLGGWLTDEGNYEEALPLLQEGYAMQQRLLGDDHPDLAFSAAPLAQVMLATGLFMQAKTLARKAQRLFAEKLPTTHWRIAWARSIEGAAGLGLGEATAAGPLLKSSDRQMQDDLDARPAAVIMVRKNLIAFYSQTGQSDLAKALSEELKDEMGEDSGD